MSIEETKEVAAPVVEKTPVEHVNEMFEKHLKGSSGGWERFLHPDAHNPKGEFTNKQICFLVNRALTTLLCFKPKETIQLRLALQNGIEYDHWKEVVDATVLNIVSLGLVNSSGEVVTPEWETDASE